MLDLSALRIIMSGWFLRDLAVIRMSRDNSWVVEKSRCLVTSARSWSCKFGCVMMVPWLWSLG